MNRSSILIFVMAFLLQLSSARAGSKHAQNQQAQQNTQTQADAEDKNKCFPKPTEKTVAGAEKALACEWLDMEAVSNMLDGMNLYLANDLDAAVAKVEKSAKKRERDFYDALKRLPTGMPNNNGKRNLLEMLPLANTRNPDMKKDIEMLFLNASDIIEKILSTSQGRNKLIEINNLFTEQDPYSSYKAMYELLSAVPKEDEKYVGNIETLRAAYKKDSGRLSQLVAGTI